MMTSISTIFTGWSIWCSTSATAAIAAGLPRTITELVRWSMEMLGLPIADTPARSAPEAPAAAAAAALPPPGGWPWRDWRSEVPTPTDGVKGLAAAAVHAAGRYALEHLGARTLVIVADDDGEAIGIYRRLGFADTERQLMLERRHGDRAAPCVTGVRPAATPLVRRGTAPGRGARPAGCGPAGR